MVYAIYLVLALVVVFAAIKLSNYVDLLDKTTKVSGAFIGGVLLAAVTSLPELFTSISATLFISQNEMVIGNILGSDLFNYIVIGLSVVLFVKSFRDAKISKAHFISAIMVFIILALVTVGILFPVKIGWLNLMSPFILIAYVGFLFLTPKTTSDKEKFVSPLTFKQIIIRFVIASVVLVAASIAITYVSDIVAEKLNLGRTLAGAILLGVATSLPELTSTIALCKKGNFDAGFGNVLGSNVFNFVILVISDVLSFKSGVTNVFVNNIQSIYLLIFCAVSTVALIGILLIKVKPAVTKRGGLAVSAVSLGLGLILIASYVSFLVLASIA